MAKDIYTGRGGKIYIDTAGGTSYTQIEKMRNLQIPPRTKPTIDVTGMEDTSAQAEVGIEEESTFSFLILHDDADAADASLETAYAGENLCGFKAELTDGTNTVAIAWQGKITGLEPQAIGGSDPYELQVSGVRTGAITHTFTP